MVVEGDVSALHAMPVESMSVGVHDRFVTPHMSMPDTILLLTALAVLFSDDYTQGMLDTCHC